MSTRAISTPDPLARWWTFRGKCPKLKVSFTLRVGAESRRLENLRANGRELPCSTETPTQ